MDKPFPFKKIMEYLTREETSFRALQNFFTRTAEGEKSNVQAIIDFEKEMTLIAEKWDHKHISRNLRMFTIHNMEHEHAQGIVKLIEQKLNYWLTEIDKKIKGAKDKTKNMQRVKDTLKAGDVEQFRTELTNDLTEISQTRSAVIRLFCYQLIKNSSQQLQSLTNLIQNQKQKSEILRKERK